MSDLKRLQALRSVMHTYVNQGLINAELALHLFNDLAITMGVYLAPEQIESFFVEGVQKHE